MRTEIIQHDRDVFGVGKMAIAERFHILGKVNHRMLIGDGNMPPAFQRGKQHK